VGVIRAIGTLVMGVDLSSAASIHRVTWWSRPTRGAPWRTTSPPDGVPLRGSVLPSTASRFS